jgi:hypothetical protein
MNRHTTFLELAAAGIDFRLTSAEQASLDGHLAGCPACRTSVAGLHADAAAIAGLPEARLDPRRAAAVLDAALHGPVRSPVPVLRLALVAALLGALVVGAALVGAELLRRMSEDDISVVPPVPTASPGPDASPLVDNGVGMSWVRVDLPDASAPDPGGATMDGVIAGGPGAIAWGWAYGLEPRIWTTIDGRTWDRASVEVPTDPDPDILEPGTVNDVTAGGPGFIAVGFYTRAETGRRGLVWTSTDGRSWGLVPHQPDLENAIIYRVLEWRGELLAFGNWSYGPSGGATPAAAWTSADGRTWTRLELDLPEGLTMGGVVAVGDRLWAAPDETGDDTGMEWTETLLTSTDGRTWTLSGLPHYAGSLSGASGTLFSLVRPWPADSPIPPDARIPGVYRSSDAATWQSLSTDPAAVGHDLVVIGPTLVMVGDDAAGDPECWADCQAMGWRSLDGGITWQAVPTDVIGGTMDWVAPMPDGTLVAVGRLVDEEGRPSPAAWVSVPQVPSEPPAATPTPGPQAVGDLWADAMVPVVDEGTAVGIEAVAAGGPGFVAVGRGTTETTSGDLERCEAVVWISEDGRHWDSAPSSDALDTGCAIPLSGPIVGMIDVAAGPPGVVAIGYAARPDLRATIWFSEDGVTWERLPVDLDLSSAGLGEPLDARLNAVTWGSGTFVAVGEDRSDLRPKDVTEARPRAAVWTSNDGRTWVRAADSAVPGTGAPSETAAARVNAEAFDIGEFIPTMEDPASAGMLDVIEGPEGLLAVGAVCREAVCTTQAWSSADGRTWARADGAEAGVTGWLDSVVWTGSRFVATGARGNRASDGSSLVLWSTDGGQWAEGDLGTTWVPGDLALFGEQILVSTSDGQLRASDNGSTWSPLELLGSTVDQPMRGVLAHLAARTDVAVILGYAEASGTRHAWFSDVSVERP